MAAETTIQLPDDTAFRPRSSNSALMSLVSTVIYPEPRPVSTGAFQHVLGLLGYEPNTTRQALTRTAKNGMLESQRVGRRTEWRLTPQGHSFIVQSQQRIRELSNSESSWDGQFAIVMAPVPESERSLRRLLRTRLMWAGFGSPYTGMWISPRRSAERDALEMVTELGLSGAHSFVASSGAIGDPKDLVERAWDLADLNERYAAFLRAFEDVRPGTGDETLRSLLLLVHGWRRFPFYDPALPRELLPTGWLGHEGARLFTAQRSLWEGTAMDRWRAIVADAVEGRLEPASGHA